MQHTDLASKSQVDQVRLPGPRGCRPAAGLVVRVGGTGTGLHRIHHLDETHVTIAEILYIVVPCLRR